MKSLFLKGSLEDELNFNLRDILHEECGLAAAINLKDASQFVYDCLVLQEHRGEKSAGIISHNDKFYHRKRMGQVRKQFNNVDFKKELPGDMAIGHNRYATKGDPDSLTNIQPLYFRESRYGAFTLGHNGTLVNTAEIRRELISKGAIFQSTTDSEIIGHLIATSGESTIEKAIEFALGKVKAAYSLLIMTEDKIFAIKDKFGVRPLTIGAVDKGYLVCSEDYTFDQYQNPKHLGDINAGEMIIFTKGKKDFGRIQYTDPIDRHCVFEWIYFSNPRSRFNNYYHEDFRRECGIEIIAENPHLKTGITEGHIVVPILDSGKNSGKGLAEGLGIPYVEAFLRIHDPPGANKRSFTCPNDEERIKTAFQKLHLRKDKIKDKVVYTSEDSIVRANTLKTVNQRLRDAGARRIINCVAAPPIVNICPNGMDYQTSEELAMVKYGSIEGIKEFIGSDELIYISLNGIHNVVDRTYKTGICDGCFGGSYPIKPIRLLSK